MATAVALVLAANLPLRELTKPETYRTDIRAEQARAAVGAVPEGASVEADVSLLAHLTADHRVYWVRYVSGFVSSRSGRFAASTRATAVATGMTTFPYETGPQPCVDQYCCLLRLNQAEPSDFATKTMTRTARARPTMPRGSEKRLNSTLIEE